MSTKTKSLIILGVLSFIWGGYFLLIQIADDSFQPITIATARMVIGAIIVFPVLKLQGLSLPPLGRGWFPLIIIGLFEALVPTTLVAFGETHVSSGLAAVLFSTMPIFTVMLAHFWRSEPFTRNKTLGVLIGFTGTVIVLLPSLAGGAGSGAILLGALAVLLASFSKAFAALYSHTALADKEPIEVAAGMMISAAVIGSPFILLFENPIGVEFTTRSLIALIAVGVFSAGVAFILFFWLIKYRGPSFASIVRFNEPPIAIGLAFVFLGASIHWTTFAGTAVILLCIAIMNGYLDGQLDKVFRRKRKSTIS
jgi:drug/metabolite transporter (DMT)-like permease